MKSMKNVAKRILTPEQIALSEERKRRKAEAVAKAAAAGSSSEQAPRKILHRAWVSADNAATSKYAPEQSATVMSWNVGPLRFESRSCLRRHLLISNEDASAVSCP